MKKILTKISAAVVAVAMVFGLGLVAMPQLASASGEFNLKSGSEAAKTDDNSFELFGTDGIFTRMINIALFLIGMVSVVMLIYGGFRYVVSSGDPGAVNNAKNTILYSIIGLIVAILSYSIVNFVIGSFTQ